MSSKQTLPSAMATNIHDMKTMTLLYIVLAIITRNVRVMRQSLINSAPLNLAPQQRSVKSNIETTSISALTCPSDP